MASGAILATIDGFTAPNAIAVTPNGSYLYVTNANSSSVSVVDTASDQIVANPLVGLLPMALAISSDGSTVYVANADGYSLSVIGTATNTVGITIARVGIYPVGIVLSAEPPTGITKSAGDGQSAMVGDAFPTPLQVTVTDGTGNPLPNTAVTFSAVSEYLQEPAGRHSAPRRRCRFSPTKAASPPPQCSPLTLLAAHLQSPRASTL